MRESVLQREPRLAELIDPVGFQEVCEAFASHNRVGLRVLDSKGKKVVDIRGAREMCDLIHRTPGGKARCTDAVEQVKSIDLAGGARRIGCFTGCHYALLPIEYDARVLGRIILGPYLPEEAAAVSDPPEALDQKALLEMRAELPLLDDERAADLARLFGKVVDSVLFSGYKSLLTSSMHVESLAASYSKLEAQNRELAEANEQLKELDRMKSNFLATVSHELKTPLTSIIGYSEMLHESLAGPVNEEQQSYLTTIMNKGEELLSLISSILDVAKVEAGNLQLALSEMKVDDVLREALEAVKPQAGKKTVQLDVRTDENLRPLIADREKIRQVLVNLLSNAVKFTPEGGRVAVVGDQYDEPAADPADEATAIFGGGSVPWLRLTVLDTGIGIPEGKLDQVFLSFYQVDSSTTRGYGGAGLGLSIARSFVEAHGGRILVKSAVGRGTQFTVLLPFTQPAGKASVTAAGEAAGEGD